MKKNLLFILIFLWIMPSVRSQQTGNNSFELWHRDTIFHLPGYLTSAEGGKHNIIPEQGHTGNYAVHLQTIRTATGELFPGAFFTYDTVNHRPGIYYHHKVDEVKFYYKAHVQPHDTTLVIVAFKKYNTYVAGDVYKIPPSMNTNQWTEISFQTHMPSLITPDTLVIAVASSNFLGNYIAEGSTLEIDNMRFYRNGNETTNPPNHDYENWAFYDVEKPDGFYTTLEEHLRDETLSVEKYAGGTDGNYAVKLTTVITQLGDTLAGAVTNGVQTESDLGGMALQNNPISLSYDIKGQLSGQNHPAGVRFVFKRNGNILLDTLREYNSSMNTFLHEQVNISLTQQADTLLMQAYSSGTPGDYIVLDHIYLEYPVAVNNLLNISLLKAFPVPAKNTLYLRIDAKENENLGLIIRSLQGKIVLRRDYKLKKGKNLLDVDLSSLAPENYLLELQTSQGSIIRKFVKRP